MMIEEPKSKVKNSARNIEDLFNPLLTEGVPLYLTRGLTNQDLDALYVIAYNLYAEKKYQAALQIFQGMLFYNHFDKRGWLGTAACLQMLKRYQDAILSYSYVSLLDSEDLLSLFHSIECYIALERYADADSALEVLISLAGKNSKFAHLKDWAVKLKEFLGKTNA